MRTQEKLLLEHQNAKLMAQLKEQQVTVTSFQKMLESTQSQMAKSNKVRGWDGPITLQSAEAKAVHASQGTRVISNSHRPTPVPARRAAGQNGLPPGTGPTPCMPAVQQEQPGMCGHMHRC